MGIVGQRGIKWEELNMMAHLRQDDRGSHMSNIGSETTWGGYDESWCLHDEWEFARLNEGKEGEWRMEERRGERKEERKSGKEG